MATTVTAFTALEVRADNEEQLPNALHVVTDPMRYHRRVAEDWRAKGVPVKDVVIKIGGRVEELSFDEFEERYM